MIVQHHKPECPVEKWDYCFQGQGHSESSKCLWMFVWRISSEPQNILLPNLVQHRKPECHAEKLVHCVQCQGHSEGLYNQSMTIFTISSKLLVHLQPNFVWWYNIISQSVPLENGITAFKVKVRVKVQNASEILSRQYPLNHITFCCQTWYAYAAS